MSETKDHHWLLNKPLYLYKGYELTSLKRRQIFYLTLNYILLVVSVALIITSAILVSTIGTGSCYPEYSCEKYNAIRDINFKKTWIPILSVFSVVLVINIICITFCHLLIKKIKKEISIRENESVEYTEKRIK